MTGRRAGSLMWSLKGEGAAGCRAGRGQAAVPLRLRSLEVRRRTWIVCLCATPEPQRQPPTFRTGEANAANGPTGPTARGGEDISSLSKAMTPTPGGTRTGRSAQADPWCGAVAMSHGPGPDRASGETCQTCGQPPEACSQPRLRPYDGCRSTASRAPT